MAKKDFEIKKELAKSYYMQGDSQKSIAARVGVTEKTLSGWTKNGGWAALRAGKNITRPELINKALLGINKLLEEYTEGGATIDADKLCKMAKVIESIDKKANVVDAIEVFIAFNKWLQFRMTFDKDVTPELLQAINKYQDLYITENINNQWLQR
jgi:transposase